MNHIEHILSCVSEEAHEVGQRACKAVRFGLDEVQPSQSLTNWERIVGEFHDLYSVLILLAEESGRDWIDLAPTPEIIEAKRVRVEKFMLLAESTGALEARSAK